jgi:hypothetical protein
VLVFWLFEAMYPYYFLTISLFFLIASKALSNLDIKKHFLEEKEE